MYMQAPLARLRLDWAEKLNLASHCSNSQDTGCRLEGGAVWIQKNWRGLEDSLFRSHKHPRRDLTVALLPSLLLLLPKPKQQKKRSITFRYKTHIPWRLLSLLILWAVKFFFFKQPQEAHRAKERSKTQRCLASWLRSPATNDRPGTMSYLFSYPHSRISVPSL